MSLTGRWQLEYIVTSTDGPRCAPREPCPDDAADCTGCCSWLRTWLGWGSGDVSGFFVPAQRYSYNPCCYIVDAGFDRSCNFTWTLKSSGVRSITLTMVSPTELRGRAHMSAGSSNSCDAIVSVIKH